jgi:60 kDa SS-A/Ro ribonucleoprotein
MTNPYAKEINPSNTPQSEPILGRESEMVKNQAGGWVFALDPWKCLTRFLVLGAEGGSYYAAQREMVLDNAGALLHCLADDGPRVVKLIADIDSANRAPKRNTLLFGLGVALALGDQATKDAVVGFIPQIVRTASDLFEFLSIQRDLRGSLGARSIRRVISAWYNNKPPEMLAYQMAKYRARSGFSHQDALRVGHPKPETKAHDALYRWAVRDGVAVPDGEFARILRGFEHVQRLDDPGNVATAIAEWGLTWEMVRSDHLASPEVWEALLPNMPYRAMIRNLGRMSSIGLIKPLSKAAKLAAERIADAETMKRAHIHPIAVLSALLTYRQGHGVRGQLQWKQAPAVVDALEAAFEASFGNIEPTGLRYYYGLDVSSSMGWGFIAGVPNLTPAMGTAALAMIAARTESQYVFRGFCDVLRDIPITAKTSIYDAVSITKGLTFGGTDCALPMIDAAKRGLEVDVFVTLTDDQTWCGRVHPTVALREYRQASGIDAKNIVVGMTATDFTIADPEDAGSLDVVGFDTAVPEIMRSFALGEI